MTAAPVTKSCPTQSERPAADGKFSHTLAAIDHIEASDNRLRRLQPQVVDKLAKSIIRCGLLQPIVVNRSSDGVLNLVAGLHRLQAVKKLGHHNIHVVILDQLDADEMQLAEIDENLVHADLSPAERALHLNERKRLYEKLYPETKLGGDRKSAKVKSNRQNGELKSRFTKDAVNKTHRSERTIQRDIERAAKIVDLADVPGTTLDTPDELDALAKLPAPVQRDLIERARAERRSPPSTSLRSCNVTRVSAI